MNSSGLHYRHSRSFAAASGRWHMNDSHGLLVTGGSLWHMSYGLGLLVPGSCRWYISYSRSLLMAAGTCWHMSYGLCLLMTGGSLWLMAFGSFRLVDSECSFGCLRYRYGRPFTVTSIARLGKSEIFIESFCCLCSLKVAGIVGRFGTSLHSFCRSSAMRVKLLTYAMSVYGSLNARFPKIKTINLAGFTNSQISMPARSAFPDFALSFSSVAS